MISFAISTNSLDKISCNSELFVHSAFEHAINLKSNASNGLISIVSQNKPLVPYGLKVNLAELPFVEVGNSAYLTNEILSIGRFVFELTRAKPISLKETQWIDNNKSKELIGIIDSIISNKNPGIAKLKEIKLASIEDIISSLIGLGPGLTPSGDDFVCGLLWALKAKGSSKFDIASQKALQLKDTTTDVSSNFLLRASNSLFVESLINVKNSPLKALTEMSIQGSTSGIDTLFGIRFGLVNF